MPESDTLHQSMTSQKEHDTETTLPPLQHQWPLLGQELFIQEHILTDAPGEEKSALCDQEKREVQEKVRRSLVAQLYSNGDIYSRDTVYLALLWTVRRSRRK